MAEGGLHLVLVKMESKTHQNAGMDFGEMSDVLNGWLNSSTLTKACLDWDVQELQQLQALFYLAR